MANFTSTGMDTYPAGQVIQVVTSSYTTDWTQTMNSSTPELINNGSSDLSISITPASTSNKVLLNFSFGRIVAHNSSSGWGLGVIVRRGNGSVASINISTSSSEPKCTFSLGTDSVNYDGSCKTFQLLDSPSSTSSVVYKFLCIAHSTSNYTTCWNRQAWVGTDTVSGHGATTTINFIATEIKG